MFFKTLFSVKKKVVYYIERLRLRAINTFAPPPIFETMFFF